MLYFEFRFGGFRKNANLQTPFVRDKYPISFSLELFQRVVPWTSLVDLWTTQTSHKLEAFPEMSLAYSDTSYHRKFIPYILRDKSGSNVLKGIKTR